MRLFQYLNLRISILNDLCSSFFRVIAVYKHTEVFARILASQETTLEANYHVSLYILAGLGT